MRDGDTQLQRTIMLRTLRLTATNKAADIRRLVTACPIRPAMAASHRQAAVIVAVNLPVAAQAASGLRIMAEAVITAVHL